MENLYNKVLAVKKYKLGQEQFLLENNIKIDGEGEVSKILSINANIDLDRPVEVLSGECLITGKTIINLVYTCENGEINNQTSVSPFSYKITNSNLDSMSKLNVLANVVSCDVDKVVNNQLKVVTTINVDAVAIKNNEVEYLQQGMEHSHVKQEEKTIVTLAEQFCDKFQEELEATVKLGVKKVLMTTVDCIVKEWQAGPNFVSVEGELYAKVLYVDNQEIPEMQTIVISKNFKQEIEADGLTKDSDLDLSCLIINENVTVELAENEQDVNIKVLVPIRVCYNAYEFNKILSVMDIYSTKDVLSVSRDLIENDINLKPEYLEGKIEGNVVLSENEPRIDKYISAINVKTTTSNAYVFGGVLKIEGIVSANIVYLNDELGSIQSVEVELPYVVDKKVDLPDQVLLEPLVCLTDVDVMVKRGREIYFDAKAKVFVNVTGGNNMEFVTRVDAIGQEPEKDGAIEIYFARAGESFWDIAKNLKIPAEIISSQNPGLSDPLDKDQSIALYFQKQR